MRIVFRLSVLWAAIIAAELALHFYLGSHFPGAGGGLTAYARPPLDLSRISDFMAPSMAIGVCLGYVCVGLSTRSVVLLVLSNWAALLALQPLWLGLVPANENWWPGSNGHDAGYLLEGAIFTLVIISALTSAGLEWNRRKRSE